MCIFYCHTPRNCQSPFYDGTKDADRVNRAWLFQRTWFQTLAKELVKLKVESRSNLCMHTRDRGSPSRGCNSIPRAEIQPHVTEFQSYVTALQFHKTATHLHAADTLSDRTLVQSHKAVIQFHCRRHGTESIDRRAVQQYATCARADGLHSSTRSRQACVDRCLKYVR